MLTRSLIRCGARTLALRGHSHAVTMAQASRALKTAASGTRKRVLTLESMNPMIKQAQYAVRGEMAIRAEELRKTLEANPQSLPFDQIINCNIGNPQQLGQQPISFLRQVSALLEYPALLDDRNRDLVKKLFPEDAIARAKAMSESIGSVGAYSHSQGIPSVRKKVAKFIQERDGYPANPDHIFLTAGASPGVQMLLHAIITPSANIGVMIPIPQYPLYTATIGLCNGTAVPYYLDEQDSWSTSASGIEQSLHEARARGVDVRALCIINPGNPTGNVLSRSDMEAIVKVCANEGLVLLADEVYQTNVYYPEERPWHSFKKVVMDLQSPVELVSFHSISKGMIGECGRRGAYFECVNMDERVLAELYKVASISLCPNVHGQIAVDLMVDPPKEGDPSFPTYQVEITHLYESLKRRAEKVCNALNALEGVMCNRADGAMYLFAKVDLPRRAVEHAKELGKEPDALYTLAMLEATGVCTVPGSGFLQEPGTFHFRCTFLPPEDEVDSFIDKVSKFHAKFLAKYRD